MQGNMPKQLTRAAIMAGAGTLAVGVGLALYMPAPLAPDSRAGAQNVELAAEQEPAKNQSLLAPRTGATTRPASTTPAETENAQPGLARAQAQARNTATRSSPDATEPDPRAISAAVGRQLSHTIELLNADRFDEARAALDEMMTAKAMAQMTPFERSRLYQLSFNLNMNSEAYEAASADLQAALESGGLSPQEMSQTSYQRAQLFVQMEDYARAADSLELWISDADVPQQKAAHYLLAASYYYQDRFDDARDVMETMFTLPGANQEAWYAMMADLYMKNADYAKAKPVVETLVAQYGRERYRAQLAALNAELEAR